jgi:hypothetical protein
MGLSWFVCVWKYGDGKLDAVRAHAADIADTRKYPLMILVPVERVHVNLL